MTKKQEQTIERLRSTITDLENEMERRHDIAYQVQQHLDTLLTERLELVDKATPMKAVIQTFRTLDKKTYTDLYFCPCCLKRVYEGQSCSNNDCRQAIDWSDEE